MNYGHDDVPDNVIMCPSAFSSNTEWQYSNTEWKALGILHGLENFHHYCFSKEVYIITNHKPKVAMTIKDKAALSQ